MTAAAGAAAAAVEAAAAAAGAAAQRSLQEQELGIARLAKHLLPVCVASQWASAPVVHFKGTTSSSGSATSMASRSVHCYHRGGMMTLIAMLVLLVPLCCAEVCCGVLWCAVG